MITEVNGIKVKEVHTVQIEEVGSVYNFDIEFSDYSGIVYRKYFAV